MTWTYTGNPTDRPLDAVRLLVGDVDEPTAQLQDEEIAYLLAASNGVVPEAAARAAESLQGRYARLVTKSVGDLRISASDKFAHYRDLAEALRGQAGGGGSTASIVRGPLAPSISVSGKERIASDDDRVEPAFRVDVHKNLGSAPAAAGTEQV